MRYSHFRHTDPGQWRRALTDDQAQRAVEMRDRGMTFSAIAAWFRRNGVEVGYRGVQGAYERAKRSMVA